MLERLGRGESPWSWTGVRRRGRVDRDGAGRDVPDGPAGRGAGSVRMAAVDAVAAARAAHVILADLAEGDVPGA